MLHKHFILTAFLLLAVTGVIGCSTDSTTHSNAVTSETKIIKLNEANKLIDEYLSTRKLSWGKPTSIRNAPGKYIYTFQTPNGGINSDGPRMLKVNIHTGKISVPTEGGR